MRTEYAYQVGEESIPVSVEREGDGFRVTIGNRSYLVRAQRPEHGRLNLQVDDRRLRAYVAHDGLRRYVAMAGNTWVLERPQSVRRGRDRAAAGPGASSVEAAMPGHVLDVLVKEGDVVTKGQTLVLLEAMKMELRIAAGVEGVVQKVLCQAGQIVERGQVLVELA
jgi:biotin carboxyl carrier protein